MKSESERDTQNSCKEGRITLGSKNKTDFNSLLKICVHVTNMIKC